jgi:quercetin dioxygenase-like cupin family protein
MIAAFLISANVPSAAHNPPPPIATELLTDRAVFTDDYDLKIKAKLDGQPTTVVKSKDPSRTVTARFTVQPGAQFPWHTHSGPVVVNVVEGELVYVGAEDCVERSYPAGTAFFDLGHGHVHTAFNPTDDETVLVATFFEAPGGDAPLVIPAEAPADCSI